MIKEEKMRQCCWWWWRGRRRCPLPSFLLLAHIWGCQITIHSRFCWSMPTLRCTVHSWNCIALYRNCIVLRHCAIVALDILKTAQGFKMLFSFACVQCDTDSGVSAQLQYSEVLALQCTKVKLQCWCISTVKDGIDENWEMEVFFGSTLSIKWSLSSTSLSVCLHIVMRGWGVKSMSKNTCS